MGRVKNLSTHRVFNKNDDLLPPRQCIRRVAVNAGQEEEVKNRRDRHPDR